MWMLVHGWPFMQRDDPPIFRGSLGARDEIGIGLGFKAPRAEIPYGRVLVPFLSYLT